MKCCVTGCTNETIGKIRPKFAYVNRTYQRRATKHHCKEHQKEAETLYYKTIDEISQEIKKRDSE